MLAAKAKKQPSPSALGLSNDPDVVDMLPAPLRSVVHEFGWSVVRAFLDSGVRNPATIRHLIHTVWLGAREPGNKRPLATNNILAQIDDVLVRSGSGISARALLRQLRAVNHTITVREPTQHMIAASIAALGSVPRVVTYEEKHRLRLRAALLRSERDMFPWLCE